MRNSEYLRSLLCNASSSDLCILWDRGTDSSGYPKVWFDGRHVGGHRLALQFSGVDIGSQTVRHTCDTPRCVNPRHLIVGTQKDNIRDMIVRGRAVNLSGSQHGRAQTNEETVKEIKRKYSKGDKITDLACMYGMKYSVVWAICKGKNWKSV